MKIIQFFVLSVFFFGLMPIPRADAVCYNSVLAWQNTYCTASTPGYMVSTCEHVAQGYTCSKYADGSCMGDGAWNGYRCTRNNYSAAPSGSYTLIGTTESVTVTTYSVWMYWDLPSPFIYLHNAPEGEVTVSIDSALDAFAPLPLFNQKAGWKLNVKDSVASLEGSQVDHLFYELALNKIDMTRNGRNFASKDEVITYLNDSDFLTKLGFSEEEKNNSLGYLIPKIREASDTEYYYLTVLEPESIAAISTLTVTPEPNRIDRQYFAVYPTDVPVRTDGDFVFPKTEPEEGFTVKETGEFLINSGMFVFFK